MRSFCIIGLGETGVTIASLLISNYPNAKLVIIDPADWISGRYLDLAHAAAMNEVKLVLNNPAEAATSEFFFYCAGVRNEKGEDRISVIERNKNIIALAFKDITPTPSAKIIVVTNPVELIAQWIYQYFDKKTIVFGTGTALDSFRLKYLLERDNGGRKVVAEVVGEHGASMVSLFSQVKTKSELTPIDIEASVAISLHQELVQSATEIRKTEEATKFGVAECAIYIMKALLNKTKTRIPISIPINSYWKEKFQLTEEIYVSLPCELNNEGYNIIEALTLNEQEWQALVKSVKKLKSISDTFKDK